MLRKIVSAAILCAASVASAQKGPDGLSVVHFDPESAVDPISNVEGPGIKVGEGTVLHPVFGIETGFVSNVFYEPNGKAAGILRLLGQIGTSSLHGLRLNPNAPAATDSDAVNRGSLEYDASLRLAYDQPLSTNDTVNGTGGLGIGARFRGTVNPQTRFSFGWDENFIRDIRAENFETTSNENRDINFLRMMLLFHPRGRSLSGYLYLQNTIDVFESPVADILYPDRLDTRGGVHVTWQWLPRTQFFGDVSWGVVDGLGNAPASEAKVESYPLIGRVGVATLLSAKTSIFASAGYTNGFYSAGPNYSSPYGEANIAYEYSPLGKASIGYGYLHSDSVNANFYRDHLIKGYIHQLFVPFAVLVQPELHLRQYQGVNVTTGTSETRDDLILQVVAGVHYNFRNWIAATIDYKFSTVQTDFMYVDVTGSIVDLDYVRHQLLAGLRVAM